MSENEVLAKLFLELAHVVPGAKTFRDMKNEATMRKALRHLDHATPQQRNGPCYQAADVLREALGLPPMEIGGKPSDGLD